MRRLVLLLAAVALLSCGSDSTAANRTSSGQQTHRSSQCEYVSTSDFKKTLGLALEAYRAGQSCSYRDPLGNTCTVSVVEDSGRYATSRVKAAEYGPVESFVTGDQGFYSAQLQVPPAVWVFEFGFMKGSVFAGVSCGALLGSSNPKPRALQLARLIASHL